MVGAEPRPPYDRPPLTKKFMTGELDDTTLAADPAGARAGPAGWLRRPPAWTGGCCAPTGRSTPSTPWWWPPGPPRCGLPGGGRQRFLRTFDDALALRDALLPGTRLAVVGAGWIGAELATAAAARGCQVTVVEAAAAPLAGALGGEVGCADRALVRGRREWICGWASRWNPWSLVGSRCPAAGGWPADLGRHRGRGPAAGGLAGRVRVGWSNGVAVDGRLRASVPGVYAAGDCAAFVSGRYGRRLRVEHWDNALHAPRVVAANMLGGGRDLRPGAVLLVGAVRPDGPVRRAPRRRRPAGLARRPGGRTSGRRAGWGPDVADGVGERLAALLTVERPRDLLQGRRRDRGGRRRWIPPGWPTRASRSATPCPPAPDDAVAAGA